MKLWEALELAVKNGFRFKKHTDQFISDDNCGCAVGGIAWVLNGYSSPKGMTSNLFIRHFPEIDYGMVSNDFEIPKGRASERIKKMIKKYKRKNI